MKCKHCGNDELFYRKGRIEATIEVYYNADKSFAEDGSNVDPITQLHPRESKYYYCASCNKRGEPAENEIDDVLRQFGG